ncbi:unnamed protein product [Closterium sp. NIES-54]
MWQGAVSETAEPAQEGAVRGEARLLVLLVLLLMMINPSTISPLPSSGGLCGKGPVSEAAEPAWEGAIGGEAPLLLMIINNFPLFPPLPSSLPPAEAYVGKGRYLKRLNPHGRGRSGVKHRYRSRLTVVVREMSGPEEERVERQRAAAANHRWLRRVQRKRGQIVPHKVVEVGRRKEEESGAA